MCTLFEVHADHGWQMISQCPVNTYLSVSPRYSPIATFKHQMTQHTKKRESWSMPCWLGTTITSLLQSCMRLQTQFPCIWDALGPGQQKKRCQHNWEITQAPKHKFCIHATRYKGSFEVRVYTAFFVNYLHKASHSSKEGFRCPRPKCHIQAWLRTAISLFDYCSSRRMQRALTMSSRSSEWKNLATSPASPLRRPCSWRNLIPFFGFSVNLAPDTTQTQIIVRMRTRKKGHLDSRQQYHTLLQNENQ